MFAALALLRRFRDGTPPARGARACVGILTLADFADDFAALGIATRGAAKDRAADGFDRPDHPV